MLRVNQLISRALIARLIRPSGIAPRVRIFRFPGEVLRAIADSGRTDIGILDVLRRQGLVRVAGEAGGPCV